MDKATVRQLLIQLADFSLPFSLVESTWVLNAESDTLTVDRSKVVDLYKSIVELMDIRSLCLLLVTGRGGGRRARRKGWCA